MRRILEERGFRFLYYLKFGSFLKRICIFLSMSNDSHLSIHRTFVLAQVSPLVGPGGPTLCGLQYLINA